MITVEVPIKDPRLKFPDRCVNCGKPGSRTLPMKLNTRAQTKSGQTTAQTYAFPYVLGAFVGMIAGILAGTLVEFVVKMTFAPVYGKLLLKRPLTVVSILSDSEDVIGLSTRFTNETKTLKLMFENDDIAREFIALNPQET